ncbi:carbohydrate sulfotransferase 10-like [Gigantopelta aegis]|uniref:carbohydrate sulfotransferase 10-like n=1 Tax=Gigantopelta aegis TaxID=1735272 RepID=UPI001B8893A9|nr:carbohydrate sulfotransferase 10-like [Gigantopelta aegis]
MYLNRVQRLKTYCQKLVKRNFIDYENMWLVDQNYKTLFCSLAKVGSTFWNHVFHILRNGNDSFSSPFSLNPAFYENLKNALARSSNSTALLNSIRNDYLKVMFVREPYRRLFSAYVDKLVQPHGYYWNRTGKHITYHSKKRNKRNMACGHNVSFEDVVNYVVHAETTLRHRDIHFAPMHHQCNICSVDYQMIGKMETFRYDTVFFLNSIKAIDAGIAMDNWTEEHDANYIKQKCIFAFKVKNSTKQCLSFYELLKRQWRAFQIVGLISKDFHFPFTDGSVNNITLEEYTSVIISVHNRSGSSAKANQNEAFKQAYTSLSRGALENLRDVLFLDFQLFGYNPEPDELFSQPVQHQPHKQIFNYFDFL